MDLKVLTIDGSYGEGGGQILRTTLTLSALTGKAIRIDNIRAHRARPGLAAQHLTAVRAVARVCRARVSVHDLLLQQAATRLVAEDGGHRGRIGRGQGADGGVEIAIGRLVSGDTTS